MKSMIGSSPSCLTSQRRPSRSPLSPLWRVMRREPNSVRGFIGLFFSGFFGGDLDALAVDDVAGGGAEGIVAGELELLLDTVGRGDLEGFVDGDWAIQIIFFGLGVAVADMRAVAREPGFVLDAGVGHGLLGGGVEGDVDFGHGNAFGFGIAQIGKDGDAEAKRVAM